MPILQSRFLSVIGSARAWESAWRALRALTTDAIQRHGRREITDEELYTELGTNAAATEPGAAFQVALAVEEHHFRKHAKRNSSVRQRMAAMRQGKAMAQSEANQGPEPRFDPPDPLSGLGDAPTPAQLAADAAMMQDADIEEELRLHIAALKQGDQ